MDYEKREISSEEVNTFIRSLQIPYFEVSAKTGIGIEEGFSYIINQAVKLAFNLIKPSDYLIIGVIINVTYILCY